MKRNNGPGDQIDGKSDKNMQDLAQDDDNSVSEKVSQDSVSFFLKVE